MKHTPGPWSLDTSDWPLTVNGPEEVEHGGLQPANLVCLISARDAGARDSHYTAVEAEANGRLIAAAPELLSALNALVQRVANEVAYGDSWDETIEAEAAIVKATHS